MTNVYTSPDKRHFDFIVPQDKTEATVKASLSGHLTKTLLVSLRDMDRDLIHFIVKGL